MVMKKLFLILPLIITFYGAGFFTAVVLQEAQRKPDVPVTTPAVVLPDADDLWRKTNDERKKADLAPLDRSPALDASAMAKCADMQAKKYWAHNDPSGASKYYDFIREQVDYRHAGENLAQDTGNAVKTISSWMASQGHRDNILDVKWDAVGFAVCNGAEGVLTVQHFAAR